MYVQLTHPSTSQTPVPDTLSLTHSPPQLTIPHPPQTAASTTGSGACKYLPHQIPSPPFPSPNDQTQNPNPDPPPPGRFEIQIGIIAACTPALHPGYRWLRDKTKAHLSATSGREQLTDEVRLRSFGEGRGKGEGFPEQARWVGKYEGDLE